MKGVLSGGRMVWVDKVLGGNQIGGIVCFTQCEITYISCMIMADKIHAGA